MDDALQNVTSAAWTIAPELGIIAAATLLVLLGAFLPTNSEESRRTSRNLCMAIALVVMAVPLVMYLAKWNQPLGEVVRAAPFARDVLARVVQPVALLSGLGLLLMAGQRLNAKFPAEHLACLLFIIAGTSLATSANDLVSLFVSLELISIPTYVLLYLSRPDKRALESTVKYFLLSIFSSAFLLYGMSLMFGSAGSTNFAAIAASLRQPTGMVTVGMLEIALVMVVAGLGFRIAAVPFHFYAPDVFQGTTLPVAAVLAIVPKIAGFVALLRLTWSILLTSQGVNTAFSGLSQYGIIVVASLAFASMTIGNVLALLQTDLRRLLAYSSIAHAGYMLVGVAVPGVLPIGISGAQAVLFYLLAYSVMTLGAFGVLVMVQKQYRPATHISDLAGLGTTNLGAAILLAVFLLGLTGLPPTVGFWGKFNLFLVAWASNTFFMKLLAVGLALNAAIAAWYYLRIVKTTFLDPPAVIPSTENRETTPVLFGVMGVCAIATIALFFAPGAIWTLLRDLN